LKAELVNRLQALLDEEEFNLADDAAVTTIPDVSSLPTTSVNASNSKNVDVPDVVDDAKGSVDVTPEVVPNKAAVDIKPKITTTITTLNNNDTTVKDGDLSFEEKKRLRAQRFAIPFVETKRPVIDKTKDDVDEKKRDGKRQKTDPPGKKTEPLPDVASKDEVLLSKDEIEKQLKRAEKYGGINQTRIDELKAMLRKHRFASTN
jgi:SAP domain-containing ribonucleoprotein